MNLTTVLDKLEIQFVEVSTNLKPTALKLLVGLFILEVLWSVIKRKPEDDPMNIVFWKVVTYFLLFFSIQNYQEITKQINKSFLQISNIALGSNVEHMTPSFILENGLFKLETIWSLVQTFEPKTYVHMIIWLLGVIVLVFMALMIFLAYLEYALLVNLAIIFIPFKMFKFTSFMGDKVFNLIISQNIKIMIISFIGSFVIKQLGEPLIGTGAGGEVLMADSIGYIAVLAGMMFLLTKASSMANSLTSGSASDNDTVGIFALGAAAKTAVGVAKASPTIAKGVGASYAGATGATASIVTDAMSGNLGKHSFTSAVNAGLGASKNKFNKNKK